MGTVNKYEPRRDADPAPRADRIGALSGIMRGMNDPESKPRWYRALVTRTPRGRKLRRRALLAVAVLTCWLWIPWIFGWSPRMTAARFGWYRIPGSCHQPVDCAAIKCEIGRAGCAHFGDKKDPLLGACVCPQRKDVEARVPQPPAWCRDAKLLSDNGYQQEWSCSGTDPPDGGDGGT